MAGFQKTQGGWPSPLLVNALTSLRADWCQNDPLRNVLLHLLRSEDVYYCMPAWACVAQFAVNDARLVEASLDAVIQRGQDEMALSHAWETIVQSSCGLKKNANLQARLDALVGVSCTKPAVVASMVSTFAKWRDVDPPLDVVEKCFDMEEWSCANAAVQWLDSRPLAHPATPQLVQRALSHWARPVRRNARLLWQRHGAVLSAHYDGLAESVALLLRENDNDGDMDADTAEPLDHFLWQPGSHVRLECYDQ